MNTEQADEHSRKAVALAPRSFEAGIQFSIVAIRIAASKHDGAAKAALLEVAGYLQADAVPDEATIAPIRKIVPGSPVSPRIG